MKTGDISWDNVDYLCQWQSQILNNIKFSVELHSNNVLDISEQIKQEHDIVEPTENGDDITYAFEDGEDEYEDENEVSKSVKSKLKGVKRLKKSSVHEHFDRIKIRHPKTNKTSDGAICKHCRSKFSNRISTNLKTHLKVKHPEAYDQVQSKYQ